MCHRTKFLGLAALGIALGWAAFDRLSSIRVAFAGRATAAEEKQVASSEHAWQRLKAGNNRFVEGMLEKQDLGANRRQELAKGQKPFAVVLAAPG
jgi:carbonic anhydrase